MLCDCVNLPENFLKSLENQTLKNITYKKSTFKNPQRSVIWHFERFEPTKLSSLDKSLGLVENANWDINDSPALRLGLRADFNYPNPLDWRFYDKTQVKDFLYTVGITNPSLDSKELTDAMKGFPLYMFFSGYNSKSDYNLSMAEMNLVGIGFNKDLVDIIASHYGVHHNYNLPYRVTCNIFPKEFKKE